jgi:hypothetical protein
MLIDSSSSTYFTSCLSLKHRRSQATMYLPSTRVRVSTPVVADISLELHHYFPILHTLVILLRHSQGDVVLRGGRELEATGDSSCSTTSESCSSLGTSLTSGIKHHSKDHRAYCSTSGGGITRTCGRERFCLSGHLAAKCMSSCLRDAAADSLGGPTGYGLGRGYEGYP